MLGGRQRQKKTRVTSRLNQWSAKRKSRRVTTRITQVVRSSLMQLHRKRAGKVDGCLPGDRRFAFNAYVNVEFAKLDRVHAPGEFAPWKKALASQFKDMSKQQQDVYLDHADAHRNVARQPRSNMEELEELNESMVVCAQVQETSVEGRPVRLQRTESPPRIWCARRAWFRCRRPSRP